MTRAVTSQASGHPARNAGFLILALVVAWQGLYAFAGRHALTPPGETLLYLAQLLGTSTFWGHLWETGRAFAAALAIAVAGGLAIGFALGINRLAAEAAEPVLVALYSIPKITLYPIVLLAFGIGLPAKIAFGAIHGIVPIAIFTMSAVRNVSPVLLKTARVMKLNRAQMIRKILFPAAMPEIFTSLRIGFSLTLIGTLLGEMFGSQRGLGYLLMTAIGLQNIEIIMAVTLLLVLFAASISTALLAIDRRLHRRA
jgi:NitT/TauT family transport system permease protein